MHHVVADAQPVHGLGVLQQRGRLLAVGWDSKQGLGHRVDPRASAEDLGHAVGVDSGHPDAAVQLVAVAVIRGLAPRVDVHRRRNRRAVVGDVGLQGTVEEQVVLLALPDAWPVVVAQLGQLVDVHAALEVQLVPEGLQGTEGGCLRATEPLRKKAVGKEGLCYVRTFQVKQLLAAVV